MTLGKASPPLGISVYLSLEPFDSLGSSNGVLMQKRWQDDDTWGIPLKEDFMNLCIKTRTESGIETDAKHR